MGILAIVALVFALACLGYFIFRITKLIKTHEIGEEKHKIQGKERTELLALAGLTGGFLTVSAFGYVLFRQWPLKVLEYFGVILGPLFFGIALVFGLGGFFLYYYKLDLDEKQKKVCRIVWPIAIAVAVIGLWLYTEGIALHINYPLISGVGIPDGAIYGGEPGSGFKFKFYGILIVSGALICYAITDHMTYQKFKKHGLIDSLFIVAFLFGILGARLWYCIVLEPELYFGGSVPPLYFLYGIVDGGLAIQGGAILGIAAGVTFMLLFRKYIDVRFMMDVAVPTILIAQFMGRWGNFFNQEVYGAVVDPKYLWFLPTIIRENMFINGAYRIPLFFIEGVMNLAGFFFIRYFLGKICKFHIGLGYQASSYLVWYGMTRAILELLRDKQFQYMKSWYIAFGMMAAGLLMILGFYLLHRFRMQKGLEDKFGEKV